VSREFVHTPGAGGKRNKGVCGRSFFNQTQRLERKSKEMRHRKERLGGGRKSLNQSEAPDGCVFNPSTGRKKGGKETTF